MSQDSFDKFNTLYPNTIFKIGEIVEKQGLALFYQNQPVDFKIKGWEHF